MNNIFQKEELEILKKVTENTIKIKESVVDYFRKSKNIDPYLPEIKHKIIKDQLEIHKLEVILKKLEGIILWKSEIF